MSDHDIRKASKKRLAALFDFALENGEESEEKSAGDREQSVDSQELPETSPPDSARPSDDHTSGGRPKL